MSVILWRGESCLLVCRGGVPNYGLWSFPGGRVEGNESLRGGAVRELYEETGLRASLPFTVGHYHFGGGGDDVYDLHVFMGFWASGEACAGDDALSVRWVLGDDILSGIFSYPTTPGLRSVLRDGVRILGAIK